MSGTFSTKDIGKDLLIGVLVAAVSIPISMGYAMVAGLPAIYGLYGSFLPILCYGFITSSPRFVFGVDAAPAALTGALLLSLGIEAGSETAVSIMPMITVLTAAWLFLLFFFSANRLMKFISEPVMGGFITGIGITIILMQLPKLYGGSAGTGEAPELIKHIVASMGDRFHLMSFMLGLGTVVVILLFKHFFPKLPMQAIVMAAGAVLGSVFSFEDKGVAMLPSVSAGLSMLLILLFGTPLISYLPVPILTGIVISALIGTFEFRLARKLRRVDRSELRIFWAALIAVLLMGTIYGVIVGVLLSSITFIVRQTRPKIEILGVDPEEEGFHSLKRKGNYAPIHGVLLYRFSGALFFANINDFEEGLKAAITPEIKTVVVDAAGIGSVDVTAAERLLHMYRKLKEEGKGFYLAGHVSAVNAELRAFGAGELIESGAVFSRISLALKDAGYEKPYILDPLPVKNKKDHAPHLSERSWAYGEDAEDHHLEYLKKRSRSLKKTGDGM